MCIPHPHVKCLLVCEALMHVEGHEVCVCLLYVRCMVHAGCIHRHVVIHHGCHSLMRGAMREVGNIHAPRENPMGPPRNTARQSLTRRRARSCGGAPTRAMHTHGHAHGLRALNACDSLHRYGCAASRRTHDSCADITSRFSMTHARGLQQQPARWRAHGT